MALNRDWQIKEAATYWQNKANKEAQKTQKIQTTRTGIQIRIR